MHNNIKLKLNWIVKVVKKQPILANDLFQANSDCNC